MVFKKIPFATVVLTAALLLVYFTFSSGTPYLPTAFLNAFSLSADNAVGVFTHLFIHIGIFHLLGNIIPLLLFAALLEASISSLHVIAIFFASGILSGLVFSFINPNALLLGASAAISGLMASATALRPKRALFLLIAVPLLLFLAVFPLASFGEKQFEQGVEEKKIALEQRVTQLIQENRVEEAAQVNASLQVAEAQLKQTREGRAREEAAPTDFTVHAFGALVGICYLFVFQRGALRHGFKEFESLGESIFALGAKIRQGLKRKL